MCEIPCITFIFYFLKTCYSIHYTEIYVRLVIVKDNIAHIVHIIILLLQLFHHSLSTKISTQCHNFNIKKSNSSKQISLINKYISVPLEIFICLYIKIDARSMYYFVNYILRILSKRL